VEASEPGVRGTPEGADDEHGQDELRVRAGGGEPGAAIAVGGQSTWLAGGESEPLFAATLVQSQSQLVKSLHRFWMTAGHRTGDGPCVPRRSDLFQYHL
jgi:hypothetical protein